MYDDNLEPITGPVPEAVSADVTAITDGLAPNEYAAAQVLVTPTQVRRPWRSVGRTMFQALVAFAIMWPIIVDAADLPDWAWVGASVAIAGGLARVMALPQVEAFLRHFLPFLSAAPNQK